MTFPTTFRSVDAPSRRHDVSSFSHAERGSAAGPQRLQHSSPPSRFMRLPRFCGIDRATGGSCFQCRTERRERASAADRTRLTRRRLKRRSTTCRRCHMRLISLPSAHQRAMRLHSTRTYMAGHPQGPSRCASITVTLHGHAGDEEPDKLRLGRKHHDQEPATRDSTLVAFYHKASKSRESDSGRREARLLRRA